MTSQEPPAEPVPEPAVGKKKRKKKGAKASTAAATNAKQTSNAASAPDSETYVPLNHQSSKASNNDDGGWSTVSAPTKRKAKKDVKPVVVDLPPKTAATIPGMAPVGAEEAGAEAKEEGPPVNSVTVQVAGNKIGGLIGPKGETLMKIEMACDVKIQLPQERNPGKTIVTISGADKEGVRLAEKCVKDLCTKGYSAVIAGADFEEGSVMVPPRYVPTIIGTNGVVIKALREKFGTTLTVPKPQVGQEDRPLRVLLAGEKAGVKECKMAIKEMLQVYYSKELNPELTHVEYDIDPSLYSRFSGPRGSNIRHIQGDSLAKVYVPREWSINRKVVIVGTKPQVAKASRHVQSILQQLAEPTGRDREEDGGPRDDDEDEEPHEEWMDEYMYRR